MLSYFRPTGDAFETFWFQCAQGGWDPYTGSQFTIEFQAASESRPGQGGRRWRFPALMTGDELEQVRFLQNVVIQKLSPPPREHWAYSLEGDARRWYFARFDLIRDPFPERTDIWLRYAGDADVRRWADFFLPILPRLLENFGQKVRRAQGGG